MENEKFYWVRIGNRWQVMRYMDRYDGVPLPQGGVFHDTHKREWKIDDELIEEYKHEPLNNIS